MPAAKRESGKIDGDRENEKLNRLSLVSSPLFSLLCPTCTRNTHHQQQQEARHGAHQADDADIREDQPQADF